MPKSKSNMLPVRSKIDGEVWTPWSSKSLHSKDVVADSKTTEFNFVLLRCNDFYIVRFLSLCCLVFCDLNFVRPPVHLVILNRQIVLTFLGRGTWGKEEGTSRWRASGQAKNTGKHSFYRWTLQTEGKFWKGLSRFTVLSKVTLAFIF